MLQVILIQLLTSTLLYTNLIFHLRLTISSQLIFSFLRLYNREGVESIGLDNAANQLGFHPIFIPFFTDYMCMCMYM